MGFFNGWWQHRSDRFVMDRGVSLWATFCFGPFPGDMFLWFTIPPNWAQCLSLLLVFYFVSRRFSIVLSSQIYIYIYTHTRLQKPHCTYYTPLTASTSSLASTPKRLPSAKWQHGFGTPEDLWGCTTVQIWIYFFVSTVYICNKLLG